MTTCKVCFVAFGQVATGATPGAELLPVTGTITIHSQPRTIGAGATFITGH